MMVAMRLMARFAFFARATVRLVHLRTILRLKATNMKGIDTPAETDTVIAIYQQDR